MLEIYLNPFDISHLGSVDIQAEVSLADWPDASPILTTFKVTITLDCTADNFDNFYWTNNNSNTYDTVPFQHTIGDPTTDF